LLVQQHHITTRTPHNQHMRGVSKTLPNGFKKEFIMTVAVTDETHHGLTTSCDAGLIQGMNPGKRWHPI
jgi:hypothetical protein